MNNLRKKEAWDKRDEANILAFERPSVDHKCNGDEQRFRKEIDGKDMPIYAMSFTKGLPHDPCTGLLKNPQHFKYFVKAIDSGDPKDFRHTPLGPDAHCDGTVCKPPSSYPWFSRIAQNGKLATSKKHKPNPVNLRAWESQSAGLSFALQGVDAQAVTMPPHPKLGKDELTAEMAEIYVQALLRDVPFNAMNTGKMHPDTDREDVDLVQKYADQLSCLPWFSGKDLHLSITEKNRRKGRIKPTPSSAFRGITTGDNVGPYLSQFLLIGNQGINGIDKERDIQDGQISFGAISIDQKVRVASKQNYMTKWEEWLDVQNAAAVVSLEAFDKADNGGKALRRFMHTPRDLATYVHYDALYEAYFNACLILLNRKVPFDPGIPFQANDSRDHQQGFAHFGGPHILTLVTEVATRALKAVRFQKFNIHRRCRPEVVAARITKADHLNDVSSEFAKMRQAIGVDVGQILNDISKSNGPLYENKGAFSKKSKCNLKENEKNYLLPMAFTEGSPMHPAYGAGHATVAGACVTVLKAFFDCNAHFKPDGINADEAFVSIKDGRELDLVSVFDQEGNIAKLTVEGELNKLASNISIGRNWAGVHYFTDYYESLLMGEKIAISILEEQKLLFNENFSMTIPLFDGGSRRI